MATPRGAEHRDLEERFRKLERTVRDLVSAALRRDQLSVDQGDFSVNAGGNIVLSGKGGALQQVDDQGRLLYQLSDIEAAFGEATEQGMSLQVTKAGDLSSVVFALNTIMPGTLYPDGYGNLQYSGTYCRLVASTTLDLLCNGGTVGLMMDNAGTTVYGNLKLPSAPTTSAAANTNLSDANGTLRKVSSSLRYKTDVADAPEVGEAFLAATGATWRDKAEVEGDPDTTRRHAGFIAEQLHDLGLGQFLTYDDQGRPDSVQYDRLTVPLLQIAQAQAAKVEALEARLEKLEGLLA